MPRPLNRSCHPVEILNALAQHAFLILTVDREHDLRLVVTYTEPKSDPLTDVPSVAAPETPADVSPSVAAKAVQSIQKVLRIINGGIDRYDAPELAERLTIVRNALREVRDAAPGQYATLPPSDYE